MFLNDLVNSVILCLSLFLVAYGAAMWFGLTYLHGILFIGIEIIMVFALKAFIQSRKIKK